MSDPGSAPRSAVHEQDDASEGDAQAWRARTRDSVPSPGAKVIDLTQRSRERMAGRWGKPMEEPPPDPPLEDGDRPHLRDVLNQVHLYRGPSPSVRAIWHDLAEGGQHAYEDGGAFMAFLYWFPGGIVSGALAWVGETIKISSARVGRVYATGLILLAFWGALALAGANPVPFSALIP